MKLKDVLYMNKQLNEPQMSCKMIVELRSGAIDSWAFRWSASYDLQWNNRLNAPQMNWKMMAVLRATVKQATDWTTNEL